MAKPQPPMCALCTGRKRWPRLYDHIVCRTCQLGFAGRRRGSFFVDFVIFGFVSFIIYRGLSFLLAPSSGAGLRAYEPVAFFGGMLAFTAALLLRDGVGGRSPGKAMNDLRVVRRDSNGPIGFAE
ncbi:MAG: RDD family protein, partial [Planctomycetota bacterium]